MSLFKKDEPVGKILLLPQGYSSVYVVNKLLGPDNNRIAEFSFDIKYNGAVVRTVHDERLSLGPNFEERLFLFIRNACIQYENRRKQESQLPFEVGKATELPGQMYLEYKFLKSYYYYE